MRMRLVISMDGLAWYLSKGGLAYLIDLPEKMQAKKKTKKKMGKGEEKRQFLTEKARDRERALDSSDTP